MEYSLSERGRSLIPVIDMMCNWGAAPAGTAGAVRNDLGQASSALRGAALQLNVQNLTDKKYVSSCSGEYACIYGSGRSIIFGQLPLVTKMGGQRRPFFRLSRRLYSCFSSRKCLYTVARPIDSTLAM